MKKEAQMEKLKKEAKNLIDKIGPFLGCGDHTYEPVVAKGRDDVCAVSHMAEDGYSYGFDTVYLVWKDKKGNLHHRELINSRDSKDYIQINEVAEEKGKIVVKVSSGGSYSGSSLNLKA